MTSPSLASRAAAGSTGGSSAGPGPSVGPEPSAEPEKEGRPVRVAHLVSHPIQYYVPLYRELSRRPDVDLTVYYYSDGSAGAFHDPGFGRTVTWGLALMEGYRARMCPSAAGADLGGGVWRRPNWDLVREVRNARYDVVWIHGYNHPTTWLAAAAARLSGARILIREDQTLLHGRPWPRRLLKRVALRGLFSQAAGLYAGEQSRRHFVHHGMPPGRLFPAPHCVDNATFRARGAILAPERARIRASFGIPDDAPVVLFCGKLIEKKQPLLLLDAFARVREGRPCWLLLVGDGPLRADVEARAHGIPGVRVAGFLDQTEIPSAYAAADLFVLPSAFHETWGLVVNEAMNFALPIIVSDKVGCGADLVRPGWNGYVVGHHDVAGLAAAIETLVDSPGRRRTFGARSLALVDAYSVESCADGIAAACRALARPGAAS
jgi:glycosyltransferase involved in cell wall biosynthesis